MISLMVVWPAAAFLMLVFAAFGEVPQAVQGSRDRFGRHTQRWAWVALSTIIGVTVLSML
jgi:hypothetical protein